MSDKLCAFPWIHMSANQAGDLIICCNTYENSPMKKNDGTIWKLKDVIDPLEYFNSDSYQQIRLDMINGKEPEVCKKCYDIERNGGRSVRQNSLDESNMQDLLEKTDLSTGKITDLTLSYVHFMWGNKCNLKCKMCDPMSSDQLVEEFKLLRRPYDYKKLEKFSIDWGYENNKVVLEKIAPYIEIFNVTGGEPLINNDFLDYCYYLVEKGFSQNIKLSFHTNLNVLPSKFVDVWQHFKSVIVKVSLDAIEDDYEYIRYPGKWRSVEKNLIRLQELGNDVNLLVEFHTVFSSFNVHAISNLIKYLLKIKSKQFVNFPNTLRVTYPHWGDCRILPEITKQEIKDELFSILNEIGNPEDLRITNNINNLKANIDYMLSENLSQESFHIWNKKQDKFRTIKTENVISWYNKV